LFFGMQRLLGRECAKTSREANLNYNPPGFLAWPRGQSKGSASQYEPALRVW
jgi:hypothetical protein